MEKFAVDALVTTLGAAPIILRELVGRIPLGELDARRKPHFWSIHDHIAHLAETQHIMNKRMERFRDEEAPDFTPYNPPAEGASGADATLPTVAECLDDFAASRTALCALARSLPPAVWDRRGSHPEYKIYVAGNVLRHIAMHDHWHMYRIEELWLTRDQFLTELS
jgi:DinB superfamily